jgi:hypothetical protein
MGDADFQINSRADVVTAEGGSSTFPNDIGRKGKMLSAMLEGSLCFQYEC